MRTGLKTRSERYSLAGRAWHGCGHGTGVDCGGRYRCRVSLNGPSDLPHPRRIVTPPGGYRLSPKPRIVLAISQSLHGDEAALHGPLARGSRTPCGQTVDFAVPGERVDRAWIGAHRQQDPQCSELRLSMLSPH